MFGGHGVYHDGLMFGLVADDELYLKVDAQSSDAFAARDLPRFRYVKQGRTLDLSYCLAPEEIYDDPEEAERWARLALGAALRARKSRPGR